MRTREERKMLFKYLSQITRSTMYFIYCHLDQMRKTKFVKRKMINLVLEEKTQKKNLKSDWRNFK